MSSILIIDDERDLLNALAMILRNRGHDVIAVSDGSQVERLLREKTFDTVISDIRMTPIDGLKLLAVIRKQHAEIPVILMTAFASLDMALDAIKAGAFDFITKPFKINELLDTIQGALDYPRVITGNIRLDPPVHQPWLFGELIVKSPSMIATYQSLERIAPVHTPAWIMGETGTGKQLIARILHTKSPRRNHLFQALDCAVTPENEIGRLIFGFTDSTGRKHEGFLHTVNGGTLLLKNIDHLPPVLHPGLLHFLNTTEFSREGESAIQHSNVRILATCTTVASSTAKFSPWTDLLQTLRAITLVIPPLRERKADLLPLISHIINRLTPGRKDPWQMAASAYDLLEQYPWPGNVDELEQILTHAVSVAKTHIIATAHLPPCLVKAARAHSTQTVSAEDLRGKSFRDYVRMKQMELSHGMHK